MSNTKYVVTCPYCGHVSPWTLCARRVVVRCYNLSTPDKTIWHEYAVKPTTPKKEK